jgi:hypothetical protein
MYFDYIKEREGIESIVTDCGFVTYILNDKECFVDILYIKPYYRKSGKGSELMDQLAVLAKLQGCAYFKARNYPRTFGATEAMAASIAYGFKIIDSNNEYITLAKEI